MKVKVTNNGQCPRGIWSMGTIKLVAIGASRDLDLTDTELDEAKKIAALSFEEVEVPEGDEKAELMAKLKALGINANANSKPETLRAKLDEAEAAKTAADAEMAEKQGVTAALTEKGVEFDEKDSLEELKAKLTAAQA